MIVANRIRDVFSTTEISLPTNLKILMDFKDKFGIQESDATTILESMRYDTIEAREKRTYIYNAVKEHLNSCKECPLYAVEGHTQKVAGEGALNSPLVLIGEGPGFDEDKIGRPFVGRAGRLLTTILDKMEIRKDKIYITNVIKCRPPKNRTPTKKEIQACTHNLELELSFIMPKVIIALGSVPFNLFKPGSSIIRQRGQWVYYEPYWIMPTFHPAYILRQHGKALNRVKWDVWHDFNKAITKAKELCPEFKYH